MEEFIRVELRELLKNKEDERQNKAKKPKEKYVWCRHKFCKAKAIANSLFCRQHQHHEDNRNE